MFLNYFKVALRNLFKQKAFSFINIIGLAIGIACCILIMIYVVDEISYDNFHENSEDIVRVGLRARLGDNDFAGAVTPYVMSQTFPEEFSEVLYATTFRSWGFPVLRHGEHVYSEERFYSTDSNFFNVFTVEFLEGNPENALTEPNSVVITERMRQKYFGDEKPVLGKTLNSDNRRDYKITGVVKEFPHNSHFHFDFLGSIYSYQNPSMWLNNSYYTYMKLAPGTNKEAFAAKINEIIIPKYIGPELQQFIGASLEDLKKAGSHFNYVLQPITDIHLYSDLEWELEPGGNADYVYIFGIVAVAILLIACINFMNLSTAKSAGRAKEVGIRKTLGSNFGQLLRQFLTESVIMSFFAMLIAVGIVHLMLPLFNQFTGKEFSINYLAQPWIIPGLILVALIVGLMAGSYPAFFLSSFRPIAVLSGKIKSGSKGSWLRSALVVLQFSVSIILIIGTVIIYSQLDYLQSKNLGFDKEQLVIVHKTDDLGYDGIQKFKTRLEENPNIITASNSQSLPGLNFSSNAWQNPEKPDETGQLLLWMMATDDKFDDALKFEMKEGRYFDNMRATDTTAVVINERAAKVLGFEESPLGKQIVQVGGGPQGQGQRYEIVGVMKDFHFESLHTEIRPMALINYAAGHNWFGRYVSVRVTPNNISATIGYIEEQWMELAGKQAFEYTFFDDDFAKIYENEQRTSTLFSSFSVLAIFIACLGLFGLAAYTAEQRTKEIGIRKTLGASVGSIIILLSKEFTKWIIISNLIAWPLAYYVMRNWLDGFYYRTDINYLVFLAAGVIALLIALVTVSSQAVKAALTNPVDSLKYE